MTCEVAIMNKYAVVIAADSAVTTSDGMGAVRYSKGGNKIFQLSHHEPVGIMIYGAATLEGVPWEIIIKAFRDQLRDASFSKLPEYGVAFFNFVKSAQYLFPDADIRANYRKRLNAAAVRLIEEGKQKYPEIADLTIADQIRKLRWDTFLLEKNAELDGLAQHAAIAAGACSTAMNSVHTEIPGDVQAFLDGQNLGNVVDIAMWFRTACYNFYAMHALFLNSTGIVLSGFGREQYFPQVIEYEVPGFVNQDFVYTKIDHNSCEIGHETPAAISQFAMTSSIDAFTQGLDVEAYSQARDCYRAEVKTLAKSLLDAAGAALPVDLDTQIELSTSAFSQQWVSNVADLHYHPMKRIIASLPIEEMAHLAETLVVLQSLKERVTSPSQSVGGPIDVAVITKSEGLVWIKRKHFFDAEKNLRYVIRQQTT